MHNDAKTEATNSRSTSWDIRSYPDQRITVGACPKTDGSSREVDIIGKVIPGSGNKGSGPGDIAASEPLEFGSVR